jgi:hypothetical protein
MLKQKRIATGSELDELSYSSEYAEYIMDNCHGERVICNGDTLIQAQEDFYLWEEFLESVGLVEAN